MERKDSDDPFSVQAVGAVPGSRSVNLHHLLLYIAKLLPAQQPRSRRATSPPPFSRSRGLLTPSSAEQVGGAADAGPFQKPRCRNPIVKSHAPTHTPR